MTKKTLLNQIKPSTINSEMWKVHKLLKYWQASETRKTVN